MASKIRDRVRRFLQRPATIDLTPLRHLVAEAGQREERVRGLTDAELTEAALSVSTADRSTADAAAFDDDELAELCALGREAAWRSLGERPFDVQLLGTLGLLSGRAVEMATGEGKTLSGAIAAAGFALQGRAVHVVSVNDYLAGRDAAWMRPLYELLGVSVDWIGQASAREERYRAYRAQVTYAPVSEIGFDLLRDRLCTDTEARVVPDAGVAVVDEADSVLVDEARVPLVLAGAVMVEDADRRITDIVGALLPGRHYEVDAEGRSASLTDTGTRTVENALGGVDLYNDADTDTLAKVNVALHARALLHRDVDYIVREGKVQLINSSRGRVARLQRWPDGLQAAIEAKEGLEASHSGEILDSITVQSLIGRYPTVCGMTGTAVAVAEQLREFYQLEVAAVSPNVPCIREDEPDRLYVTEERKQAALVEHVAETHATGRPVLIGTQDVAESEKLAGRLREAGLPCVVLNAKNDAEEAAIIAEAGAVGAITVSTQMAGRGTDIRLGGAGEGSDHDRVAELGGLYVVGSGRHTSSRLDDQLRGRAGRQGDPGSSVFFTSVADELVTQYAPDADPPEAGAGGRLSPREQETVEHAQRVAEGVNLELHRNTWRYNRLIDYQRQDSLALRDEVLRTDLAVRELSTRCPDRYEQLHATVGDDVLGEAARQITLYHLDRGWTEHLAYLTDLREGIHLRALGRHINPLDEFNRSAVAAFKPLAEEVWSRAAEVFDTVTITAEGADLADAGLKRPTATWTYLVHDNPFGSEDERAMRALVSMFRTKGSRG